MSIKELTDLLISLELSGKSDKSIYLEESEVSDVKYRNGKFYIV